MSFTNIVLVGLLFVGIFTAVTGHGCSTKSFSFSNADVPALLDVDISELSLTPVITQVQVCSTCDMTVSVSGTSTQVIDSFDIKIGVNGKFYIWDTDKLIPSVINPQAPTNSPSIAIINTPAMMLTLISCFVGALFHSRSTAVTLIAVLGIFFFNGSFVSTETTSACTLTLTISVPQGVTLTGLSPPTPPPTAIPYGAPSDNFDYGFYIDDDVAVGYTLLYWNASNSVGNGRVLITRNNATQPLTLDEGELIYNTTVIDTYYPDSVNNLVPGETYYYSLWRCPVTTNITDCKKIDSLQFYASLPHVVRGGNYHLACRHATAPATLCDSQNDDSTGLGKNGTAPYSWWLSCNKTCGNITASQLSEQGLNETIKLGENLKTANIPLSHIYTSQMCRAKETAQGVKSSYPSVPLTQVEQLTYFVYDENNRCQHWEDLINDNPPPSGKNAISFGHASLTGVCAADLNTFNPAECWVTKPNTQGTGNGRPRYYGKVQLTDWLELP